MTDANRDADAPPAPDGRGPGGPTVPGDVPDWEDDVPRPVLDVPDDEVPVELPMRRYVVGALVAGVIAVVFLGLLILFLVGPMLFGQGGSEPPPGF